MVAHLEHVRKDVVRQRPAQIGQYGRLLPRGPRQRSRRPGHPRVIRVQPRGDEHVGAALGELHHAEAVAVEMAPQRGENVIGIDPDHVAQLASGPGTRRHGIDRRLGIAGLHGEDIERAPAKHLLCGRQAALAPAGIDGRPIGSAIDLAIGEGTAHRCRDFLRHPSGNAGCGPSATRSSTERAPVAPPDPTADRPSCRSDGCRPRASTEASNVMPPREPRKMVGRSRARRGPSEPIRTSARSRSLCSAHSSRSPASPSPLPSRSGTWR